MGQIILCAEIRESPDTAIGRNFFRCGGIDMDEDITAVPGQKAGSLVSAHIVVRVNAGDVFILPLNGDNGYGKAGQFFGGNGMA